MKIFINNSTDMFGREIVKRSAGQLSTTSIYVHLNRMEEQGLLKASFTNAAKETRGVPRKHYRITAKGRELMEEFEIIGISYANA